MPSLIVENYLKATLQISMKTGSNWVSTGALADALGVSPGTVTSMLKTLSESGLAIYKPYEGMQLTDAGKKLALRVLRRHRLIELFLVDTLQMTWDQVHAEAENMEHAASDFLVDRIDDYLGHPDCDPHGDPIPSADGKLRGAAHAAVPLTTCPAGTRFKLVRVINQGDEFLRYLSEAGFELGVVATITSNNPDAGIVTMQLGSREITLGHLQAEQLLIERADGQQDIDT